MSTTDDRHSALIPDKEMNPAEECYVIQTAIGWSVLKDSEVAWEAEPLPDGKIRLNVPKCLRGRLFGPFLTVEEALHFVEETERERRGQAL